MARNHRKIQWVSCCPKCGGRTRWEKLTILDRREAGYPESLTGYWFCEKCLAKDTRLPQERYPADFYLYTNSNAAVVGLTGDTLKRLYKKEPSLGFMIEEGGQLISHPFSMEAWGEWYDEKKRRERREQIQNYQGWMTRTDSGHTL